MNDFVANILQNKFTACSYILLSDTRPQRHKRSQPKNWVVYYGRPKCLI